MKRRTLKILSIFIVLAVILSSSNAIIYAVDNTPIFSSPIEGTRDYEISSPYDTVDWSKYGQFKTALHVHSKENGGADEPAAVFEDHYAKNYNVVALTDHDFVNTTWDRTDRPVRTYLTTARLNEMIAGVGRGNVGMQPIPFSIEQTVTENINTYFVDFRNEFGSTIEENIAAAEKGGGISQINHPGRYTGGSAGGSYGAERSSDWYFVSKYTKLYLKYSSCYGMEIINKKDGDSASDRILWDNVLENTLPMRSVWATSNDDTHLAADTGFSFNMLLMPSNNLTNIRSALTGGTFYAVAKVAKHELGEDFVATGETPKLTGVNVDQDEHAITIKAENYTSIEWIADGRVISTGDSIDINYFENQVNKYVRAQIKGPGGIAFVQPFAVQDLSTLSVPTIKYVTDASRTLSGIAERGARINITAGNKTFTTYSEKIFGTWSEKVPSIPAGTILVLQTKEDIRSSPISKALVYPMLPSIRQPYAGNHFIKGKVTPFAQVFIKIGKKGFTHYAQNNGDFSVNVPELKANQIVECRTSYLGLQSRLRHILVSSK